MDGKRELYIVKTQLEEKQEALKQKSGACDSGIQLLNHDIDRLERFLATSNMDLDESNIDQLVYPKEPFSSKLIALTAKENAIEDCLVAMKKGYEKDQMSL
mmetsp:Transcript_25583/g.24874  ORF Transcript_25583/g.24874 Transcript_25583/m.24874 type:complete len:101 (+) Transcript_25583:794-1096(+)